MIHPQQTEVTSFLHSQVVTHGKDEVTQKGLVVTQGSDQE